MCFIVSLFPATFYVLIGFIVLFASSKAEGGIKKFGQILAVWIFILALLPLIAGAFMTLSGACPMLELMQCMELPIHTK